MSGATNDTGRAAGPLQQLANEFDQSLPEAGRRLIDAARALSTRCTGTLGAEWESAAALPAWLWEAASADGLTTIELPPSRGGHGAGFGTKIRVAEELARADASVAFALINHHNAITRIADDASEAACSELLPEMIAGQAIGCTAMSEPGAGSDFAAITTRARQAPGGWRLHGEKAWIANASRARVLLVFAQASLDERDGIGCFIVRSSDAGFERGDAAALPGMRAAGIGSFRLVDCFVPAHRLLYAPGEGFRKGMAAINKARTHVAAMNAGMIAAAFDAALAYCGARQLFGAPAIAFQGLRWSLVDVAAELEALRLLTYRAAQRIDAGLEPQVSAALAKKYAGDKSLALIAACAQAMGAAGLVPDRPLMRHLTAARALACADGTTEIMNERLGRLLFG